jgi:hypothetical protein
MSRRLSVILAIAALALLVAVPVYALPGKPDFTQHIYADGEAWGTKVTAVFKAPKGNSGDRSFDRLFVFTNGADGQLLVGEAAPGNPDYNGGRWETWTATWIDKLPHDKVVLTAYSQDSVDDPFYSIEFHYNLGHIELEKGSPGAPPPDYFECPLLPVKE